jgi:DNA-binding NarL/FixJ family response regulator
MKPIRVLLADDHALFRSGLASLLTIEPGFEVVGEAVDGDEAFQKAQELQPDIVLMDIYMPGCDGLAATGRITTHLPQVKVVVLTVSEDDENLYSAIKCGAYGYLLKKLKPEVLFEMLRGAFRGEAPISRGTATKILHEFAKRTRQTPGEIVQEPLTTREEQVLKLLSKGLTNKEIANRLELTENTVKSHLKHILAKLHLENRVQAALFALQREHGNHS